MTYERDAVIRKVAALLRLAAKPGTVGEAATAAAHAQAMMDRYELTRDIVQQAHTEKESAPDEPIESFGDKAEGWVDAMSQWKAWKWTLAHGIAKLHGCFVWRSYRHKNDETSREARAIEIVGRPGAVQTVRYFYDWLARELQQLVDQHGRGMGQVWRREFIEGAANEIIERLQRQRAETVQTIRTEYANNPSALVKVDHALAVMGDAKSAMKFGMAKHRLSHGSGNRKFVRSETAREAGATAARSIDLGRASKSIGGRTKLIGGGS